MTKDALLKAFFERHIRWRLKSWGIQYVDNARLGDPAVYLVPLEYALNSVPRYGYGKPPHQQLSALFQSDDARYVELLEALSVVADDFGAAMGAPAARLGFKPTNVWFTGLDAFALYGLVATRNPRRYLEVGSGNSTRITALARERHQLRTQIISIDPQPRADIDALCDTVIRQPLEDVDLKLIDELGHGDILFLDNSHRCFMNSDVTVCFMDLLPRLKPGVLLHVHDIWLPNDYPPQWKSRHYSEQYLLAAWLLAEGRRMRVMLPNAYVSGSATCQSALAALWSREELIPMHKHAVKLMYGAQGLSFWCELS